MDTITFEHQGQTFEVPLVVAFGPDGDLVGDVEPENCNHAGQTWSSNLDMRCTRCGSRLFLPVKLLAYLAEDTIERMYSAWCAAGWPSFSGGSNPGWSFTPERWTVVDVLPEYDHCGGLPVRHDRLATFAEAIR